MTTVLLAGAVVMILAVFSALFWWTRKSEREIGYDKPGIPEEQANGLRFGIAVGVNQGGTSGI